ncbi:hypothetical protein C7410_11995 [Paraburkholderia silvatlantica]|uniref:Uncharacterized protein n=2 Tax=Paraburkholderia silvatlantica TaxID=321895 RepID=A0A2V4UIJ0_9BURK|nr:hypothetical protein [Paraburkholderia silvatlantica]PYE19653.1 hypothetical protein C7410_11995 [Paraburkholderia silvatlantica]TDQ89516.1 hypothetical protein C7412_115149 [Paraburkholderia silvatlantica]
MLEARLTSSGSAIVKQSDVACSIMIEKPSSAGSARRKPCGTGNETQRIDRAQCDYCGHLLLAIRHRVETPRE